MKTLFKSVLLLFSLFFMSCSSDDDISKPLPQGDYDQGVLVLNEGGTGAVTYISDDFSRVEQGIFTSVNPNNDLGQFVQSIFFDDENRAYIIANGSNLITVVNRFSFEKIGEINTGLDVPRYGLVHNGKAYVTNQASFTTSDDDYVAVINLETFEVETDINIGKTVEFILTDGSHLYVQNAAFGFGEGISVINPSNNTVDAEIQTEPGLQNISINANSLFAMHESGIDVIDLNTLETTSTKALSPDLSGAKNLRISNGFIYYTFGSSVYKTVLPDTSLSDVPLLTYESSSQFGTMYGFAVNDGLIYLGDAGDFASDGFIEIYDIDGNFVFETEVGLGPNGFYFN